jgi:aminoglycoside phosphotransferase (APT) family kinase protein
MSTVKTKVNEESVKLFLETKYNNEISNINFIRGGQLSQAISYTVENKDYLLKIRMDNESLKKEQAIFNKLSKTDPTIPIPKILEIGVFDNNESNPRFYCISELCEGKMLFQFEKEVMDRLIIEMLEILYKIHSIDISETKGYGDWLEFKEAIYNSWKSFLQEYTKKHIDYLLNYFKDKPEDKEIIEKLKLKISKLLPLCPEERYLVHGDYGAHNTIAIPGRITGIIDWEISKFGDFIYDIAWLEYFGHYGKERIYFADMYKKIYEKRSNQKIKNFEERLTCYILCVCLHMAYFYCTSSQIQAYESDKPIILSLLK